MNVGDLVVVERFYRGQRVERRRQWLALALAGFALGPGGVLGHEGDEFLSGGSAPAGAGQDRGVVAGAGHSDGGCFMHNPG